MPLDAVFQHLPLNELFRLSWGAKNTHGDEWTQLEAEFQERLVRMRREAIAEGWLKPQGIYGYWPAQSDGDDLILYDPASVESSRPQELARFSFPRQPEGDHLCLADYFAPLSSGQMDVVALQIVTVGEGATRRFERLQEAGDYTELLATDYPSDYESRRRLPAQPHLPRPAVNQGKRHSATWLTLFWSTTSAFQFLPAGKELASP
jgi:5-methyltetrahydrofolate--homocysteine methyltransferase